MDGVLQSGRPRADAAPSESLIAAASRFGTPVYVYDLDSLDARFQTLRTLFGSDFSISFAVKANPNPRILERLCQLGAKFDASSFQEVQRACDAGAHPADITFTGPVKTEREIANSVALGIGGLVLETDHQIEVTARCAERLGRRQPVLLRISPSRSPKGFGARMTGTCTKFGIDDEVAEAAVDRVNAHPSLDLIGFHIYSGSNSLSADAIDENFGIMIEIFRRLATHHGQALSRLIFGAGFGVPYHDTETHLDIGALSSLVAPRIAALRREPLLGDADYSLELGRWLMGPAGWMVSSVIDRKCSRGTEMRMVDAGFQTHMAACGMMGSVLRRSWPIHNLSAPDRAAVKMTLAGPLCTTIDVLARDVLLPDLEIGDLIAIAASGAYGPTASPLHFISHPEPVEAILQNGTLERSASAWHGAPGSA